MLTPQSAQKDCCFVIGRKEYFLYIDDYLVLEKMPLQTPLNGSGLRGFVSLRSGV